MKTSRSRAKLPATLPRPSKRRAGRTQAASTPAAFRSLGIDLSPALRDYARRRLGMKLGKFAPDIERVTVRVADVNGPKGGVDKECRVKAVLVARPTVVVVERDRDIYAALDGALDRLERAVRATLEKRRAARARRKRAAPRSSAFRVTATTGARGASA